MAFVSEQYTRGEWMSTFRHPESIKDIVKDLAPDDFSTLLRLAASSLSSMKKEASDAQYKESLTRDVEEQTRKLKKKAEEELDRALGEKQQEVTRLRTLVTELEVQKESLREGLVRGEAEYRTSLRSVKEESAATHTKEMARMHAYTEGLQTQLLQLQEKSQAAFQSSLALLEERYGRDVERMRGDMNVRVAELQALLAKAEESRKVGSCDIGQKGEREFEELVAEYTHWGTLENTSKQPHCADWSCVVRKCKILFEVKNYASDIPKAEVTKFERDMSLHSDVPLGIFLSLKSRLQGKKYNEFMTIEWSPASQMMIYINHFQNQDLRAVFAFLDVCIDVAFRTYRLAQSIPNESEDMRMQEKLVKIRGLISHELLRTGEWIKETRSETRAVIDLLTKQGVVNQEKIQTTRSTLTSILGIMDDQDEVEAVTEGKKEVEKKEVEKKEAEKKEGEKKKPRSG